ncbi:MAG: hypothetical protein RI918_1981, partial [Pseudomonadota bacterium]
VFHQGGVWQGVSNFDHGVSNYLRLQKQKRPTLWVVFFSLAEPKLFGI